MSRRFLGALAIVVCAARVPTAAGQVAGGSISGIVTDQQGGALSGVAITVQAPTTVTAVTTGRDGSYRLSNIVPASYTVSAELAGFAKLVRERVVVREGVNLALDLAMTVGAMTEVVDVPGDTPMLESRTAVKPAILAALLSARLPPRRFERGPMR